MSLRGTSIGSAFSNSQTASLTTLNVPGGGTTSAVAGDLAILMCTAAYPSSAVSGWTTLYIYTAGIWNYYFAYKVLSSGDIATGSVTVNQSNTYDGEIGVAVFTSGTSFIESQVTSGTSPLTNSCTSAVLSSSIGVYWNSARGGSTPTMGMTPGSGSVTQREAASLSESAAKLWTQAMPGGVQTNSFTYSGGLVAIAFQAFVDSGGGGGGRILLQPGMDGLGKNGILKGGING